MRNGTGNQWRTSRRRGVMWSYFLLLQMSLAAALSTDWSPSRRRAGELAVVAVHPRSDKGGDSRLRRPKRQRLDAAPDEAELHGESNSRLSTPHDASWTGQTPAGRQDRAQWSRAVSGFHRHSAQRCQDEYTVYGSHTTGSPSPRAVYM